MGKPIIPFEKMAFNEKSLTIPATKNPENLMALGLNGQTRVLPG